MLLSVNSILKFIYLQEKELEFYSPNCQCLATVTLRVEGFVWGGQRGWSWVKAKQNKNTKKACILGFSQTSSFSAQGHPCGEMYKCRLLAAKSMNTSGVALPERVVQENGGSRRECQQCSLEKCSFKKWLVIVFYNHATVNCRMEFNIL